MSSKLYCLHFSPLEADPFADPNYTQLQMLLSFSGSCVGLIVL